jgi:glycosyltransferase involved in cell wall biosynthesis
LRFEFYIFQDYHFAFFNHINLHKNKKRILIFSSAYLPFAGGAELAVKEITDRIGDYDFDMITLRYNSELPKFEKMGNINVYRIGFTKNNPSPEDMVRYPLKLSKYFFPFSALLKAGRLHKEHHYCAIWSIMANYAGFAAMFFKIFHKNVPFILTLQEGDPLEHYQKRTRMVGPIFKKIFTSADSVQAISNFLAEYAKTMGFKGEARVVPNAVDIDLFTKNFSQDELDDIKKRLNKNEGDILIITTSRLVEKNGIADVIKAMAMMPERVKFLVLGTGPDEGMLKRLAASKNLGGRVNFLGHIPSKNLPKYLKAADVFIRPSLSEGLGNSFLEAMAAGLPVIATPVGGIPDFLFDPVSNPDKKPTGFFCQPKDPESIAEKVRYIIEHPEGVQIIKQNAYEMVIRRYDWKIVAGEMGLVFEGVGEI